MKLFPERPWTSLKIDIFGDFNTRKDRDSETCKSITLQTWCWQLQCKLLDPTGFPCRATATDRQINVPCLLYQITNTPPRLDPGRLERSQGCLVDMVVVQDIVSYVINSVFNSDCWRHTSTSSRAKIVLNGEHSTRHAFGVVRKRYIYSPNKSLKTCYTDHRQWSNLLAIREIKLTVH